jgi:putative ABC transport system permease protein
MLIVEQGFLVGTSLIAGFLAGILTSHLFVPLLQLVETAAVQIPPFQVYVEGGDYLRVLAVCLVMLSGGGIFFNYLIGKTEIHRSLKLGED